MFTIILNSADLDKLNKYKVLNRERKEFKIFVLNGGPSKADHVMSNFSDTTMVHIYVFLYLHFLKKVRPSVRKESLSLELCLHFQDLRNDTLGSHWVCLVVLKFSFSPLGSNRGRKITFLRVVLSLKLHQHFKKKTYDILGYDWPYPVDAQ